MKKIILHTKFNANDNFTVGNCKYCPIVSTTYKETSYCYGETNYVCPLGYNKATCPMEIEERCAEE